MPFCVWPEFGAGPKWLVTKTYISHIDYINLANGSGIPYPSVNVSNECGIGSYDGVPTAAKEWLKEKGYDVVMDNIFSLNGIVFGIEICLDHSCGALKNNLKKRGMEGVAQQIVTSAGMTIQTQNAAVVSGGTIVLQDGLGGSRSQAYYVNATERSSGYRFPYNCKSSNGADWVENLSGLYAFNAPMGCTNVDLNTVAIPYGLNNGNYVTGSMTVDGTQPFLTGPGIRAYYPMRLPKMSQKTYEQAKQLQLESRARL